MRANQQATETQPDQPVRAILTTLDQLERCLKELPDTASKNRCVDLMLQLRMEAPRAIESGNRLDCG